MATATTPLAATDALPARPRRVLVTGSTGSGKTTLARSVADVLGVPHHELDALFHGPGWTPRPEFADDVAAFAATEHWVAEWQYSAVRPLLLARADLLVWLDLTRGQVARQLVPRTLRRRLRRVELWNGNVEPPLWTVLTDPDHLFRWGWRTFPRTAERVTAVLADPGAPVVVRLRDRREIRAWLDGPLRDAAGRERRATGTRAGGRRHTGPPTVTAPNSARTAASRTRAGRRGRG